VTFLICNHIGNKDHRNFYGDPIYDTSSENSKVDSAHFGAFGQPYVVNEFAENEMANSEISQPFSSMYIADLFEHFNHVYDNQNSENFHLFSAA